jgi:GNAT superfamily N-acetyltransferase
MSALMIRSAIEADRERLIDLKHELNLAEIGKATTKGHPFSGDLSSDREAAAGVIEREFGKVAEDKGAILVAVFDTAIVGYLSLHVVEGSTTVAQRYRISGYVAGLAVTATWRNHGVGARLLEEAKSLCRAKGLRRMSIGVADYNPEAKRLYMREGFHPLLTSLALDIENGDG